MNGTSLKFYNGIAQDMYDRKDIEFRTKHISNSVYSWYCKKIE